MILVTLGWSTEENLFAFICILVHWVNNEPIADGIEEVQVKLKIALKRFNFKKASSSAKHRHFTVWFCPM